MSAGFPHFPAPVPQLDGPARVYEAECAVADGVACGAESGPRRSAESVEAWMEGHTRESGHRRYLRVASDYTELLGVTVTGPCRHPQTERRADDGTCCAVCKRQLYL